MRGADILRYEVTSRPISNSFGKLFGSEAAGVEVVNSLADLVGVYEQKRITLERALETLARMTRRGTLRPRMDPFCAEGRNGDPTERRKFSVVDKHANKD